MKRDNVYLAMIAGLFLLVLGFWGTVVYIVLHFVAKWW